MWERVQFLRFKVSTHEEKSEILEGMVERALEECQRPIYGEGDQQLVDKMLKTKT